MSIYQQLWANYEEKPKEEVAQLTEEKERVAKYRSVYVTEITDGMHFYAQDVETGEYCPHFLNQYITNTHIHVCTGICMYKYVCVCICLRM